MTKELYLGITDSSRNKGLALAAAEIKMNQNVIRRRLPCWYKNSRNSSGTAGTPIKEATKKEEQQIQNPFLNATNVEVRNTSSKIALYGKMKGQGKGKGYRKNIKQTKSEQNRLLQSHNSCMGSIRE